jgi:hypothetical protein
MAYFVGFGLFTIVFALWLSRFVSWKDEPEGAVGVSVADQDFSIDG